MSPEQINAAHIELFNYEPFSSIEETNRAFIRQFISPRFFAQGEEIFVQGNAAPAAHFIRSGKVKLAHTDAAGRESIVDVYGTGGIVGLAPIIANELCYVTVTALEPTETHSMDASNIHQLIKSSPAFCEALLNYFAKHTLFQCLSIHSAHGRVDERVETALLRLSKLYAALSPLDPKGSFPVRREDLARLSGTTVESAVRCLTRLKEQGVISIAGRYIQILKPGELNHFTANEQ